MAGFSLKNQNSNLSVDFCNLDVANGDDGSRGYKAVNISTTNGSFNLPLDPNHFPMPYRDVILNLVIDYKSEQTIMNVQSVTKDKAGYRTVREESIDMHDMNEYQATIAFLYLVGVVTDGR